MNIDFRDLLSAFSSEAVECLVVGAYAYMHFAEPRYTKDFDLWVARNPENAGRILRALKRFGAPVSQLSTADFTEPDNVIQFGVPPNRIDILTTIDGVAFEEAWPNRVEATYGGVPIFIISKADLITNKRASGRPQDLLDLARLLDD